MWTYLRRALKDFRQNRFLHLVTVVTISLSVVIVCAFGLFFINVNDLLESYKQGIRVMAYLTPNTPEAGRLDMKLKIEGFPEVKRVEYISKEDALAALKRQMHRQSSLLDDLKENPLPDAFEIRMKPQKQNTAGVERLARRIESLPAVTDVEYGQKWVSRLTNVLDLFRFAGLGLGVLFFTATVFIVGNTIRLMLYSRREEIDIMRLVGASDGFIKMPFYIQGLAQGFIGSLFAMTVLFAFHRVISANMARGLAAGIIELRFFSLETVAGILLCGMFVGWLGCFLSLRQFFKLL